MENTELENLQPTAEAVEERPRRRGRPPKNRQPDISGAVSVEEGAPAPKKRGRKPKKEPVDLAGLARRVQGVHQLAAMATGIPELVISAGEAEQLADAMAQVAEEFGISLGGKTGAILGLVATAAGIYAPRVAHAAHRIKTTKESMAQAIEATDEPLSQN